MIKGSDIKMTQELENLLNDPYEFGCAVRLMLFSKSTHFRDRLPSHFQPYLKDVLRVDYHCNTDFSVKYEGVAPRVVLNRAESIDLLCHLSKLDEEGRMKL